MTGALLEREAELAGLAAALDRAAAGSGAAVLVEGPPGIGKTALLRAAAADARRRGFTTMTARGAELERDWALGVVRQWLEPVARRLSDSAREAAFAGAAALAREAAGLAPEGSVAEGGHAVMHGVYWLLANLGERAPLALVLDDAQWADAASLRALAFVARRADALPLALLVARREGQEGADPSLDALAADAGAAVLRPRALSRDAVARLVAGTWPGGSTR